MESVIRRMPFLTCLRVGQGAFLFLATLSATLSGCVDLAGPIPEPVTSNQAFADLHFTTSSMLIKHHDTLPLALAAAAMDGSSIPLDRSAVRWASEDSSKVYVDTLGRVIARGLTTRGVAITAWYTHAYTTRTATMSVNVTPGKLIATTVKMTALDSTRVGRQTLGPLEALPRVRVNLFNGSEPVEGDFTLPLDVPSRIVATYVSTGGPAGEPVYYIENSGYLFGKFWVRASINLYGTEVHDSLEFTGLHMFRPGFSIFEEVNGVFTGPSADNAITVSVQPCAILAFFFQTNRPIDIVFSDSLATSDGCDPLSAGALQPYIQSPLFRGDSIGGNLRGIVNGQHLFIRRSNTHGVFEWYVRDAVTKERFNIGGRLDGIHIE